MEYKRQTLLEFFISEARNRGELYMVVDQGWRILFISEWESCIGATVLRFDPTGQYLFKRRGQTRFYKVYETKKGKYITVNCNKFFLVSEL